MARRLRGVARHRRFDMVSGTFGTRGLSSADTKENDTVLIPRIVAVSVFGLTLATGALAQTTPTTPTTPNPSAPSGTFESVRQEHPDWFTSQRPYRPCPSSVGFNGGGRGACLGCPTTCPWHF
jgi:hypothetical protein